MSLERPRPVCAPRALQAGAGHSLMASRRLLLWRLLSRQARAIGVVCLVLQWGRGERVHAEDWPHWGGPRSDQTWQAPRLPAHWPATGLPRRWRQSVGGGFGGIAVADGRVYVMDYFKQPREEECVLCCDLASGQRLWEHRTPVTYGKLDYGNGPRATPTIHDGRVFTLGAVGHAHCFEARTGRVVWSIDFVRDRQGVLPAWGFAASPCIWKNLVIFQPGLNPGGFLTAVHRDTGKEVWRAGKDGAGYATPVFTQQASGPQLVAWGPDHIFGIHPDTGKLLWQVPYRVQYGVSIATPLCRDNLAFVSGYWAGSRCIQLGPAATQAKLLWEENRVLRGLMSAPLYRDGHVYLLDKQYGLTCFELRTGRVLWNDGNKLTPRGRNPQASLVWINDRGRALILNELGDLILAELSPAGYVEQSRTRIIEPSANSPLWAYPAYAERFVLARNETELVCVELVPKP